MLALIGGIEFYFLIFKKKIQTKIEPINENKNEVETNAI
jgi:hypothetical protein